MPTMICDLKLEKCAIFQLSKTFFYRSIEGIPKSMDSYVRKLTYKCINERRRENYVCL